MRHIFFSLTWTCSNAQKGNKSNIAHYIKIKPHIASQGAMAFDVGGNIFPHAQMPREKHQYEISHVNF